MTRDACGRLFGFDTVLEEATLTWDLGYDLASEEISASDLDFVETVRDAGRFERGRIHLGKFKM